MKFSKNLLQFLPFGYLYLVVMGILKESVYYNFFDINILKYSNIMDILISPVADITSNPTMLLAITIILILLYFAISYLSKNNKKSWVKKIMGSKNRNENLTEEEIKINFGNIFVFAIAICLLSFFLGIGLGSGKKVSSRLADGTLKYNNVLVFNSGESNEIYLLGSNSMNYFYIENGSKNVQISPISSVKKVKFLNNNNN